MLYFYPNLFAVVATVLLQGNLAKEPCKMMDQAVSEKFNSFGLDLYRKLAKAPGNVFFSPISISFALGMTSLGAKGPTLDEVLTAMKMQQTEKGAMHSWFKDSKQCLFSEQENFILATANKLYGAKGNTFLDSFLKSTSEYYGSELEVLDFGSKADQSRQHINGWVKSATKDKIKDLLPSGSIDGSTKLVLVNAIYFKANWHEQFLPKNTKDADFYVTPQEVVKVPTMHGEVHGKYGESNELKSDVLELPYKGDRLSMLFILPKLKETSLQDVESKLTGSILSSLSLHAGKVEVYLPKFKMELSYSMKDKMGELGVRSMFNNADFSGMDGTTKLRVSAMMHKAFVDVNEEGTEAAAATGMKIMLISRPIYPLIRLDHPFIFLIHDKQTKAVLFLGRYVKPGN